MKTKLNLIFQAVFIFVSVSSVFAGDVVSRKYREQFIVKKDYKRYYKIQANVIDFLNKQTSPVTGLVESFRGTSIYSYDVFTNSFIYGKEGVLDDQSFTYDGAIAALAYLSAGKFGKTADILNVYRTEFYCIKNDNYGLFNSYKSDKPAAKWGLSIGIDGDRMHVGPNLWVAIAAIQYTAITGKLNFLPLAIDISRWVDAQPHYKLRGGHRGAVSMGFGWGPDWTKVYSTENIVDDYAVKKMLKQIYEEAANPKVKKIFAQRKYLIPDINKEMFAIERWLMEVAYDKNKKTFNMGANESGIDKTDALDAVSWTIAAVTPERLIEMGADPYRLMSFADKNYCVEENFDGYKIKGYDFTNVKGRKKNYRLLWFEGTGFHIVSMQLLSKYAISQKDAKKAEYFRQKAAYFLNEMNKASVLFNIENKALPYTAKKAGEKEIFTTFRWEWEIPRGKKGQWVSSVSSTGWYLLALSAFNPFGFDKNAVEYKLFKK